MSSTLELTELLHVLRIVGAQLSVKDGRLRVEAPAGALTPDLQEQLRLHRDALLALASIRPNGSGGPARSDHAGPAPLSHAQERVWLVQALDPDSTAYNLAPVVRLEGPLDLQRLRSALTRLVERHEPLRTRIAPAEFPPNPIADATAAPAAQHVDPVPTDVLRIEDVSHLPDRARRDAIQAIIRREQARPVDLAGELPFRAVLVRIAADQHQLITAFHHIAVDGTSILLFYRDLLDLYAGREPAPLPIRYSDYARWERARWQGDRLDQALAFWTSHLDGAPPVIDLPTDFPRPANQTFTGGIELRTIAPDATARVGELVRGEGASVFMLLVAAFSAALHRASGERDLVIGVPVDGRTRPEVRDLIGMFVNQIALRLQVPRGASLRDLLVAARDRARDAFVHQDLPFSLLVNTLGRPLDRSRTPVFQVMVNVLPPPMQRVDNVAGDVTFSAPDEQQLRDLFDGQAKFDLTLYGREHDGRVHLSLVYNRDLFDEQRMRTMLEHVELLLVEGTRNPDRPIDELFAPRASSPWSGEVAGGAGDTIVERFHAAADECGSHIALVDDNGEVSWEELRQDALRIAQLIAASSTEKRPVGVFVQHGAPAAAAVLGVLLAGRPYVPLDPAYPAARLRFMAEDAALSLVLVAPDLTETAASIFDGITTVVPLNAAAESVGRTTLFDTVTPPKPDDLAYLLYTSGSTGQPKAVVQTHRNLLRQADRYGRVLELGSQDRVTLTASLSFDASLMDLFGGLLRGATVVFVDLTRVDFAALPSVLRDHGCTTLHTTPSVLRTIASSAPDAQFDNVRVLVLGGEPVSSREVAYFDAAFPDNARLINLYGSAEHSFSFAHVIDRDAHRRSVEIPLGTPVGDVEAVLLDADGRIDPVRGELAIRSSATALGYWNRAELTERAFVPDPQRSGSTLYRTGDIVRRRPDGEYVFLHRADRQLKIRGHRLEPREVETVLAAHPAVAEVAVHGPAGTDEIAQVAACLVLRAPTAAATPTVARHTDASTPNTPTETTLSQLQAWCRERLPAFAVPTLWNFVDKLPRTPSGKIDYRALPLARVAAVHVTIAPRNAEESELRELWSEVLGAAAQHIGVTDDFFEHGGHSLSATQVVSRIRSVFEVELPLRHFFDHPTIAETAAWIRENRSQRPVLPPIEPAEHVDTVPLSFSQERMWFLQELSPTDTAYNMMRAARVVGRFDVDRFFRALDVVAQRQEMLRTIIPNDRGRPHQLTEPHPQFESHRIDLRALPESMRMAVARDQLADIVARPFDLATGPLMRAAVAVLADEEHVLAVGLHHIAGDQWSFGIFTREVAAVYEHGPDALPPLPVQYRDVALWQRRYVSGPVLARQLDYWKEQLRDLKPLDLPTDLPRPAHFSFRGDRVLAAISNELERGIHKLSISLRATPFMVLLAAFKVLLHSRSRQDDIAVGVPIANRTQKEMEALIGTFVNTLVHRNDLSGNPTFRELVERVRHTALGAYTHQDLPFEFLVKELNPPRDTSRAPIFQVMFNLANAPAPTRWLQDVSAEPLILRSDVAQFDVTLNAMLHETGSGVQITYNTDLFEPQTAQRMLDHYLEILSRAVAIPDAHIAELAALPPTDLQLILEEWNRTDQRWPDNADLPHLVAAQAERTPNRYAVDSPTGSYTYAELVNAARRISNELANLGVTPGARVAIVMERSRELLAGLIGILGAGAAYVPVDPAYPEARVGYMLQQSGAAAVLTHNGLAHRYSVDVPVLDFDAARAPLTRQQVDNGSAAARTNTDHSAVGRADSADSGFVQSDPDRSAYVIFTSGSTGQPKGVEVPHRALTNFLHSMAREPGLHPNDTVLAVTTISFDIAALELFLPLTVGARVIIADEDEVTDGHGLARRIRQEDVTLMQATPATWKLLLASGWMGKRDLRVLSGGEALPPAVAEQLLERVAELWNMYGPTETTVWSTVQRVLPGEPILIGRPIANTRLYILDAALRPVPIGVPGELWIGGTGVAKGYIGRPELTAERFIDSPFREGERIYRTGDLVRYRTDGTVEHLGRLDHQVKVRGYRIELGEVESVLRAHPGVRDAVVAARDDRLVAWVIHESTMSSPAELRTWLAEQLPPYMVPSMIMPVEAFPLTANGKVDRNRLPQPGAAPADVTLELPVLPGEQVIAQVWAELLQVERIGRSDNFFELGGHSLLAMEAVALVEERTGHRLEPRALFFKSLRELAASITSAEPARV